MAISSRWKAEIPNCSLQQWIFGSSSKSLPSVKVFFDADRPETHHITMAGYRLLAKQIAIGLQRHGIKPGDRVLVFSGNNIFFPCVFLGILMAGGIFTGANPGFVARELAYQLHDSGAVLMISAADSLKTALDAAKQAGLSSSSVYVFDTTIPGSKNIETPTKSGTNHWTELIATVSEAQSFEWVEPVDSRNATCCLNYSSGTTGVPKGVEISHYNYVANGTGVIKVSALAENYKNEIANYRGICFLPLYHAYAQTYFVANFAKQGIPTYIMPKFDFLKLLTHIEHFSITHLTAVPPVLIALVKHPATKRFDLSSLESVGSGAAPLAADISAETERLIKKPDLIVRQGWGMTELTCTALSWDLTRRERNNSVGELMPNCSAKLVNENGVEIESAGKSGELWVSGPTIMKGYWNNPKATTDTIVTDCNGTRWMKTGDIAYADSCAPGALFFIVDRIKELIKVKGHQVAPAELEALLLERPDVVDAAVVGVTISGEEVPRAYLVRSPGSDTSAVRISEWLAGKVTNYKRLIGGISFVDSIPKNPSGKILRKILREQAKREVGDQELLISKLS